MKNKFACLLTSAACVLSFCITPIQAKGDVLRPWTFGFGDKDEVDEGVYEMVEQSNLKHLTFEDSKGNSINYWIHVPTDEQGKPIENLPLVLYMHGYSDGGGDNNIAIRYHNALLFKLLSEQDNPDRQAIILVPQTPEAINTTEAKGEFSDQWVGIEPDEGEDEWTQWNNETWSMDETPRTDNLNVVVELINKVQSETKSDKDRAYISGISMGGYTTWDLISRDDSDMFAAAVPICGVGDPTKIENAKDIPIRTFHGSLDTVIDPNATRLMYKEMRKYGNITFTEYADEEHPCWNSAYSPTLDDDGNGVSNLDDLINWMFNQSRNGTLDGSVDKAPLQQMVNDAKNAAEKDYDEEDWSLLQTTITEAEKALAPEIGEEETKKACLNLDTALSKAKVEDVSKDTGKEEKGNVSENNTIGYVILGVEVVVGILLFVMNSKKKTS